MSGKQFLKQIIQILMILFSNLQTGERTIRIRKNPKYERGRKKNRIEKQSQNNYKQINQRKIQISSKILSSGCFLFGKN